MMGYVETLSSVDILRAPEAEIRGRLFSFGGNGSGPAPGPLHSHQIMALERIEAGAHFDRPVSGIVHYPTGAGKTRVGLELIARALRREPQHRFIWATHAKNLVQQSMLRLAELAHVFPARTTFTWVKGPSDLDEEATGGANIVFMTRKTLSDVLFRASDSRTHAWRRHLESGAPLTLIYDECHQLGAEELQLWLERFAQVLERARERSGARRWRIVGLSATPVPSRQEAHRVLGRHVFPKQPGSTCHDWPFHVFHRVHNETLVKSGVLCNPTTFFDRTGEFDIPEALLREVIGESRLAPPGPDADPLTLQRYALQFNKYVLANPRMLDFLADRVGRNIQLLGKTIVFLPNIDAANAMAERLYARFPELRGSVAAVHSRMRDLRLPGQVGASVEDVLDRFRRLGTKPSVLVNVDMLTEGFDDPKIRTVVLARLTLSTNRFWQMIGRGTRGPASHGTTECYVIDPVKLTRLYDYFAGYQPNFAKDDDYEFEDVEERGAGLGRIAPQVPTLQRPPDPAYGGYRIDPELARVHANVALALRHFLDGGVLAEYQAVDAARLTRIDLTDGGLVFRASTTDFDATASAVILLGAISNLERRTSVDLGWFRHRLPGIVDECALREGVRALREIEARKLWTEAAWAHAVATPAVAASMREEAPRDPPPPESVPAAAVPAPAFVELDPKERAVVGAAIAVAQADGSLVPAEVSVIVETLRRMFGRAPSEALTAHVAAQSAATAGAHDAVLATLAASERQLLLLQLAEVAAADGIVTEGERTPLRDVAETLGLPSVFLDAVLGAYEPKTEPVEARDTIPTPAPAEWDASLGPGELDAKPLQGPICSSCRLITPVGSFFCPACGTRLTAFRP